MWPVNLLLLRHLFFFLRTFQACLLPGWSAHRPTRAAPYNTWRCFLKLLHLIDFSQVSPTEINEEFYLKMDCALWSLSGSCTCRFPSTSPAAFSRSSAYQAPPLPLSPACFSPTPTAAPAAASRDNLCKLLLSRKFHYSHFTRKLSSKQLVKKKQLMRMLDGIRH